MAQEAQIHPGPEPRELRQDAQRNRLSVLRAARTVFRERGLEATTRSVAHHAGVSAATVHRRFPGRDALVADLAEHAARELVEHFRDLARTVPADLALERALRVVAAETVATRACAPEHRERFADRARELDERVHLALHRLLVSAQEGGRIAATVTAQDLRLVRTAVTAVVAAEPDTERAGRAAQRMVTHFVRSFRGTD
ncbi:helix-turn-helix transcriptional regulator [Nocardiopsis eucommiae]|uniref:Helix-turn-helix transcriptional regulator n=1 Tax=Nocardiopsis eucommiae TaxID=2831970 RepID=A0A975LDG6_9ACTN|nr:helix-turn-helix transcriptional regulator [Nocardiopsis eucommiae]